VVIPVSPSPVVVAWSRLDEDSAARLCSVKRVDSSLHKILGAVSHFRPLKVTVYSVVVAVQI